MEKEKKKKKKRNTLGVVSVLQCYLDGTGEVMQSKHISGLFVAFGKPYSMVLYSLQY